MNFFPTNNPCPCESGIDYQFCCGAPNRSGFNFVAKIAADGTVDKPLTPTLQTSLNNIANTPDWFPVKINLLENSAILVKMSPFWFNESVFLDAGRIMGSCALKSDLQWLKKVADKLPLLPAPSIFHTAFCGSTLMSRALEIIYDTLPLREPDALGTLLNYSRSSNSNPQYEKEWYHRILKLLSRRFEKNQAVVIKTNDYANPILSEILKYTTDLPVLFMYTPLNEFLSGCLKAENRKQWIADRYRYIMPHVGKVLHIPDNLVIKSNDYGKMAALYWSYNISHYLRAQEQFPSRIKSLDFNSVLADPKYSIETCAQWFNLTKQDNIDIQHEINWLFGVYSKNTEYKYNSKIRRNEIIKNLADNPEQLKQAESLAQQLLADNYPYETLANHLM